MTKKPFEVFNTLCDTYYPDACQETYEEYSQVVLNGDSQLYDKWHTQYHINQQDFLYGLKWLCYDLRRFSPTGIQTALAIEHNSFTGTYKMRPLTYDINEFGVPVYTNALNNITKYDVHNPNVVDLVQNASEVVFTDDSLPWLDNQQAVD